MSVYETERPGEGEWGTAPRPPLPPGRVSLLSAARRYWLLVALPAIGLCIAAVALASTRAPNYTAEARVTVSSRSVDPLALGSFVTAANALAAGYSRAVDGQAVISGVSRATGVPPTEASTALTASPVPDSPVIRIVAVSDGANKSINLANSASDALIRYTTNLNRTSADSSHIFSDFKRAAVIYENAKAIREKVASDVRNNKAPQSALAGPEANLDTAKLKLDAIGQAYHTSQQGEASARLLQVLSRATSASSDRTSKMQIAGFGGFVAGLLIGLAAAVARTRRLVVRGRV
jgi:capsular polysaccharide biosynthesis protein